MTPGSPLQQAPHRLHAKRMPLSKKYDLSFKALMRTSSDNEILPARMEDIDDVAVREWGPGMLDMGWNNER